MYSIALTATSPVQTFAEPLTVAEVREFLNLPETASASVATLSFPEIPDGGNAALTFAMAGAVPGDQITPAWPSTLEAGLFGTMIITAVDTVEVRLFNLSGASITPAAQAFSARSGSGASGSAAMLAEFIVAAREIAEICQGRDLVRKQYDKTVDYFWQDPIDLRDQLVSVDLVRHRDSDGNFTTLTEGTHYIVDTTSNPGRISSAYGETWPSFTAWPLSSVLIRFTAGPSATDVFWADSGKRIKVGMRLLISSWYNNRLPFEMGNSEGMNEYAYTVSSLFGYGSVPRVG